MLLFIDGLHKNWESGAKSYVVIGRLNRHLEGDKNEEVLTYDKATFENTPLVIRELFQKCCFLYFKID
jgi:hypothetical protein